MSIRYRQLTRLMLSSLLFGILASVGRGDDETTQRLCKTNFAARMAYKEEYQARIARFDSEKGEVTFVFDAQRELIRSELAYLECVESLARDTAVSEYVRQLTRERRADFLDAHVKNVLDMVDGLEGQSLKQAISQFNLLTKLRNEEMSRHGEDREQTVSVRQDDTETRMKKQRLNNLKEELDARTERYEAAADNSLAFLLDVRRQWIRAQLDLLTDPKEIVVALGDALDAAKHIEALARARYDADEIPMQDVSAAIHFRLVAEIELLRAKANLSTNDLLKGRGK